MPMRRSRPVTISAVILSAVFRRQSGRKQVKDLCIPHHIPFASVRGNTPLTFQLKKHDHRIVGWAL
jgi:hypothetical protein